MRAAEQLRAAAGEKARQLRAAIDAQAQSAERAAAAEQAKAKAEADARAKATADAEAKAAAEATERARAAKQAEAAEQARAEERVQAAKLAEARAKAAEVQARARAEAEAAKAQARALADIPEAVTPPEVVSGTPPRSLASEPRGHQAEPLQAPRGTRAPAPGSATAAALSPSAQEKVDEWKAIAEATWADASIVLKDIQVESERYIRENPTRAALTALGVGFVLGVLLKR